MDRVNFALSLVRLRESLKTILKHQVSKKSNIIQVLFIRINLTHVLNAGVCIWCVYVCIFVSFRSPRYSYFCCFRILTAQVVVVVDYSTFPQVSTLSSSGA